MQPTSGKTAAGPPPPALSGMVHLTGKTGSDPPAMPPLPAMFHPTSGKHGFAPHADKPPAERNQGRDDMQMMQPTSGKKGFAVPPGMPPTRGHPMSRENGGVPAFAPPAMFQSTSGKKGFALATPPGIRGFAPVAQAQSPPLPAVDANGPAATTSVDVKKPSEHVSACIFVAISCVLFCLFLFVLRHVV